MHSDTSWTQTLPWRAWPPGGVRGSRPRRTGAYTRWWGTRRRRWSPAPGTSCTTECVPGPPSETQLKNIKSEIFNQYTGGGGQGEWANFVFLVKLLKKLGRNTGLGSRSLNVLYMCTYRDPWWLPVPRGTQVLGLGPWMYCTCVLTGMLGDYLSLRGTQVWGLDLWM